MTNVQKFSIDSVIKLLEDNILKEDVLNTAIFYLREYAEKKDELEEQMNKGTLELHKAAALTRILTEMLEEKAKEDEVTA